MALEEEASEDGGVIGWRRDSSVYDLGEDCVAGGGPVDAIARQACLGDDAAIVGKVDDASNPGDSART